MPPLADFERLPLARSIAPDAVEGRFARLHAAGRFYEMWDVLAEDAQRAWGSRSQFMLEMPRFEPSTELIDVHAKTIEILDRWTDRARGRDYRNVARLVMRYTLRRNGHESTFERVVHLIPAAAGWRTICYPAGVGLSAGSATGR